VRSAILLLSLLLPLSAQAGVYRCKDASGQTVIADKPCAAGAENLERRYAAPAPGTTPENADVVDEVARRRDFYISQGYPKDLAAQKALSELMPSRQAGDRFEEESGIAEPPRPKTGRDNMRDYLQQREREKNEQEQKHREWLQRSDEQDAEREQQQRDEAAAKRRADCEHNRRVEELRRGYSSKSCY